jgi:CyaY protein
MTESEFLGLAESTLDKIEQVLEQAASASDLDIECSRAGNVLEIELIDADAKIIVNSQAPMQEIWVAAKSGGFHYKRVGEQWIDTRNGTELFAALSEIIGKQTGQAISLNGVA